MPNNQTEKKHELRIHIDQNPYESPNPTTGEALYVLGDVKSGFELYREVTGDREDVVIPNDSELVYLKEDEHFHSGQPQEITIIVNGQEKKVTAKKLSFEELVALAFSPIPPGAFFTVTYRNGVHGKEGSLQPGQKVKLKDGMIFDVTETGQS